MTAAVLLYIAGNTTIFLTVGQRLIGRIHTRQLAAGLALGNTALCTAAWLQDAHLSAALTGGAAVACAVWCRHAERRARR